ncbi:aminoglycoside phosphotransferase family protein [Rugosimonospora acidiphila]|uniref:Aminoglycoside phosphotransferase family protein n=1 Tax=Rugosimonospora acidiphila TaxID=556531 RepID=A0ABP9S6Y1_9ACTN
MVYSRTKVPVSDADLATMVRRGFGAHTAITECAELPDGCYNAAYRLRLDSGARLVLKVAPPPRFELLTHEVDLMRTEVHFYERAAAAGVPVPAVAYADLTRTAFERDYVFLELLTTTDLRQARGQMSTVDAAAVDHELGAAVARLHTVTGDAYGYPLRDSATWRPSWREAFGSMVDDILADATRLGTELPEPPDAIARRLERHADALDAVRRPALVHFDLWDGNVFARPTGHGWRLSGLIDGERAMYADPYAEFVSLALFRDPQELPELLDGYASVTGEPVEFTEEVRTRLALYTCYLYLVMVTEGPTREYEPSFYEPMRKQSLDLLANQLAGL